MWKISRQWPSMGANPRSAIWRVAAKQPNHPLLILCCDSPKAHSSALDLEIGILKGISASSCKVIVSRAAVNPVSAAPMVTATKSPTGVRWMSTAAPWSDDDDHVGASSQASPPGVIPFLLADIGEGIAEVELLQWFVKEGDPVRQFDPICEVQSDKATVEITSRYDGKITSIQHKKGDMVQVGSPLLHLTSDESDAGLPKGRSLGTAPEQVDSAKVSSKSAGMQPTRPVSSSKSKQTSTKVDSTAQVPFLLADIGEGIAEVELLQWFVQEGDQVQQFDRICEVQSDKATVEITSRYDGRISSLEHEKGDMVKVGTPLLYLDSNDAGRASHLHTQAEDDEKLNIPSIASQYHLSSDNEDSSVEDTPSGLEHVSPVLESAVGPRSSHSTSSKVLTTPAIRKLAKEYNLDLSTIIGSGPKGRVLKGDVLIVLKERGLTSYTSKTDRVVKEGDDSPASYIAASKDEIKDDDDAAFVITSMDQADLPLRHDTAMEIRGYTRLMVQSMTASLQIPHMVYADEINVTGLRTQYKKDLPFLPYCIKATSMSLSKYPLLNASYVPEENRVMLWTNHNIGIAMDTPRGLIVPVIKQVQKKSLTEIVEELTRLKQCAKDGSVPVEDLQGATFTLSNIGAIGGGGTYMSPIVTLPQVAIGALGQAQRVPRFKSDDSTDIFEAHIVNVSWGGDHRVVDGATLARFHTQWKQYLQDPVTLIQEMK